MVYDLPTVQSGRDAERETADGEDACLNQSLRWINRRIMENKLA